MLTFQSIGSGSSGNSYFLQTDQGALLIDAGIAERKFRKHTREYGISLGKVAAILVTHHHIDHIRTLGILNQKDGMPVYMTEETKKGIFLNRYLGKKPRIETVTTIYKGSTFRMLGMEITPFSVPHDSRDNIGFFISHDNVRLCIVTDCGHWTNEIERYVSQATHLVLESNYDPDMLANGPYPIVLQNRIRNGQGHLSNPQAAEVIARHCDHLKIIWLCHLSEQNNTPQLALASAKQAAGNALTNIIALDREKPSKQYDLEELTLF
ncbi:MAG: MBL fold metallo-hydrolase [Bacteroidaceae bacterium]|nr:MBL fold metallo-hydrolase [Bacteroidaceae bacterium]MBP5731771.1 MBL fold metallo-hydrolase [Bacteroidaceae bacterium]